MLSSGIKIDSHTHTHTPLKSLLMLREISSVVPLPLSSVANHEHSHLKNLNRFHKVFFLKKQSTSPTKQTIPTLLSIVF